MDLHGVLGTVWSPHGRARKRAVLGEHFLRKLTIGVVETCGVNGLGNHLTESYVLPISLLRSGDVLSRLLDMALLRV